MLEAPEVGLAVVRILLGVLFVAHGLDILTVGMKRTTAFFDAFRVPLPKVTTPFAGLLQTVAGLAIVLGVFAQVAAGALVLLMIAAIAFVHGRFGFPNINIVGQNDDGYQLGVPGFEFNYSLIAGLLAIAIGGPGLWTIA